VQENHKYIKAEGQAAIGKNLKSKKHILTNNTYNKDKNI
jgi:hypothetical protein